MTIQELTELAEKKKLSEVELKEILIELKEKNIGLIGSIRFVKINQKISLREATELVINSDTWIDEKESFIQFQEKMLNEFIEVSKENNEKIKTTFTPNETIIEIDLGNEEEEDN